MSAKQKKGTWRVDGFGKTGVYIARTAGNAVSQFRRQFGVTTKTDTDTGGWKGISVECRGDKE